MIFALFLVQSIVIICLRIFKRDFCHHPKKTYVLVNSFGQSCLTFSLKLFDGIDENEELIFSSQTDVTLTLVVHLWIPSNNFENNLKNIWLWPLTWNLTTDGHCITRELKTEIPLAAAPNLILSPAWITEGNSFCSWPSTCHLLNNNSNNICLK